MTPGASDLWFLPLGGCGEIGMNLNLYGHDGRWLMVDCGITFARPGEAGPHVQMPDPSFIEARRDKLDALVITHAHEDHVGAVPYLWRRFRCPVYVTAFTAEILRRKLAEAGMLDEVPLRLVRSGDRLTIGPFDLEWLALTHSTPETQALVIRTAAGSVFHTADWKLDPKPVLGDHFAEQRLRRLADEKLTAMVCDSTNATVEGRSTSEGALFDGLLDLVSQARGRVVVGCFGSNVARLVTLVRVAEAAGRHAGLIGRSLRNYFAAARDAGLWPAEHRLIEAAHLGYLPPAEVLAIATGSQGEGRAALDRLAADTHPDLSLAAGDTVIFSSRVIPGNEEAVARLRRRLRARNVTVIEDGASNLPIHASGHPARDELDTMYRWVRPALAVPVHGEDEHMQANAGIAAAAGVPTQLTGRNGDLFLLSGQRGVRRGAAAVGRLGLEGSTLLRLP